LYVWKCLLLKISAARVNAGFEAGGHMLTIPKTFKVGFVVAVAAISLCAAAPVSAAGRGGGHNTGSYSRGGHDTGSFSRGGRYTGSYSRGGRYTGSHSSRGYYGGHYRGRGWGSRFDFGLVIGDPYWGWGPYYPYSYPYYPYSYPYYYSYPYSYSYAPTAPSLPQEYMEQTEPDESAAAPPDVWYYCPGSKAYYPYVRECPGGWETVAVEPQSESEESAPEQSDDWYYCPGSKAYYPYVKECPGGWQTVPAGPPSGTRR
jgi:hypothetical protein